MDHNSFLNLQRSSAPHLKTTNASQGERQINAQPMMNNYELKMMLLRQEEEDLLNIHQVQSKKRLLDGFSRIRLNSLSHQPTSEQMRYHESFALRRATLPSMGESHRNHFQHPAGYPGNDERSRKEEYIMALRQELEREEAALQHVPERRLTSHFSTNSFQSQESTGSIPGHATCRHHDIREISILSDQRDHPSEKRITAASARCKEEPFPQEERDDHAQHHASLRSVPIYESQRIAQNSRQWGDHQRIRSETDKNMRDCGRRLSRQEAARYGLRSSLDTRRTERKRLKMTEESTEASGLSTDLTIKSTRSLVMPVPSRKETALFVSHQKKQKDTAHFLAYQEKQKETRFLSYQEKLDLSWYGKLNELKEYKRKHGHCNVSVHDPENKQLGMWLSTQRQAYKGKGSGRMTDERIKVLESLGVEWIVFSPFAPRWDEYFKYMKTFKAKHGHINVPRRQPAYRDLGEWLESQRRGYQRFNALGVVKGGLSYNHVEMLESIGIDWTLSKDV
jgi:hypothetical protein